jgi:hypothetical protein
MEQSLFSEISRRSDTSPPLITLQTYFLISILIIYFYISLVPSRHLFGSGFPNEILYAFLTISMRAEYPAHLGNSLRICFQEHDNSCVMQIHKGEYKLKFDLTWHVTVHVGNTSDFTVVWVAEIQGITTLSVVRSLERSVRGRLTQISCSCMQHVRAEEHVTCSLSRVKLYTLQANHAFASDCTTWNMGGNHTTATLVCSHFLGVISRHSSTFLRKHHNV